MPDCIELWIQTHPQERNNKTNNSFYILSKFFQHDLLHSSTATSSCTDSLNPIEESILANIFVKQVYF